MADDSAEPRTRDTARFRLADGTLPPRCAPSRCRDHRRPKAAPALTTAGATRGPAGPRETFRFLENNLMEIDFSGKVFIKQGTIYSYGGNLTFWVKDKRPGGQPALVIITGTGR